MGFNSGFKGLTLCCNTIPRRIVFQEHLTFVQVVKIFPVFNGTSSRPAREWIYATP